MLQFNVNCHSGIQLLTDSLDHQIASRLVNLQVRQFSLKGVKVKVGYLLQRLLYTSQTRDQSVLQSRITNDASVPTTASSSKMSRRGDQK